MRKVTNAALGRGPKRNALPKRNLLYIEDNDDNWIVAKLRLADAFELTRAATDVQACEFLKSRGTSLSGVLVDIELQGSTLNGIQLVKLLRGTDPGVAIPDFARDIPKLEVPVLFLTAYGQVYSEASLKTAGGDGLVEKPVDFKKLNLMLMRLQVNRL